MREIKKHIFLETISYENRHMSPRNLYIIRGEERSLMVDTSNNTERDWSILKGMIDALGIDCRKLDIFITSIRIIQAWYRSCRSLEPGHL